MRLTASCSRTDSDCATPFWFAILLLKHQINLDFWFVPARMGRLRLWRVTNSTRSVHASTESPGYLFELWQPLTSHLVATAGTSFPSAEQAAGTLPVCRRLPGLLSFVVLRFPLTN